MTKVPFCHSLRSWFTYIDSGSYLKLRVFDWIWGDAAVRNIWSGAAGVNRGTAS